MDKVFKFNSKYLKNIHEYANLDLYETNIYSVSSIKNPKNNTLIFVNSLNEEGINKLNKINNSIILLNKNNSDFTSESNCVLFVSNPRREYAKLLTYIIKNQPIENKKYAFNSGYYIGENVILGENVIIEPFAFIDHNVSIGTNCIIKAGAKIRKNTVIGDNCIIKENCVIGDDGFGVERDVDGTTYKIPHLGGVQLGNNIEVGALTCICQGTIEPTIIEDYVKIDDCVFIAHNCSIGKGSYIIANAEVSGSVRLGRNCWIAPNACIRDGINIGNNTVVGMGTVVVKDIEDSSTVVGNPARVIKKQS